MSTSRKIKLAFVLWVGVEVLCAILLIRLLGWPATVLLGLATTGLGFALVGRAGQEAVRGLSNMASEPSSLFSQLGSFSRLAAALLLIIPGFASDLVGFVLLYPPAGRYLARRFGIQKQPAAATTIDLTPDKWRAGD